MNVSLPSCGYYLFYLSVLIGIWLVWFVAFHERWETLGRIPGAWEGVGKQDRQADMLQAVDAAVR